MLTIVVVALALVLQVTGEKPEGRVVNGEVVDPPHSYPWQLSLQYNSGWGYRHICGAILYNETLAITAAHCVYNSQNRFRVVCGAHNIQVYEADRQVITVAGYKTHPSYINSGSYGFPNDIAVLQLSTPASLDNTCLPAQLATDRDYADTPAVITGWGRLEGGGALPSKLKQGEVEALSHAKCTGFTSIINRNYHVCVKDLGDRIYGGCNGDSGGPAHVNGRVMGVASFVFGSCSTSYPTVYTRISSYLQWIQYGQ